jgi:hypothetical protein
MSLFHLGARTGRKTHAFGIIANCRLSPSRPFVKAALLPAARKVALDQPSGMD